MTRLLPLSALALTLLAPSFVAAQSPVPTEMRAADFLVGAWQCADTVGDYAGTYTTTISPTLDGRWLQQVYDFPKSSALPNGLRGSFFIGFDPRNGKWLRLGAMNDGMYFGMVGTRTDSIWTYGYVLPGTSGSAVYIKRSGGEYTILGPSYPEGGKTVTEHHTCRKAG